MSAWLSAIDAVLTAVAAGATVTAVVMAKRTLRSSRAAEQQMAATAQHLAAIAGPIRETAETLGRLQQAVHAEAAVARANRDVERVTAALHAVSFLFIPAPRTDAARQAAVIVEWQPSPDFDQHRPHFLAALSALGIPPEDSRLVGCWRVASIAGKPTGGAIAQAFGELTKELAGRQTRLAEADAKLGASG
ncbi:MAG: hypothetical protein ACYDEA_04725 [Candidatus Dormibacteria bacterium]